MRILVGAILSRFPCVPGSIWNRIQTTLGLQRLGHDVYYVEDLPAGSCVNAKGEQCVYSQSMNRLIFQSVMTRFNLSDRAYQIYANDTGCGGSLQQLSSIAEQADLLINMSGHVANPTILEKVKRRVYVDQDPVYTQLWHAAYGKELNFAAHDIFFSVGQNIGTSHSPIPDCGVHWNHVLPPVVLDYWPISRAAPREEVTTIASFGTYSDLQYQGQWYRSKHEEFKKFWDFPLRAGQAVEAVVKDYRKKDSVIKRLLEGGWQISQGDAIANLDNYQAYIRGSRAEIGIAKHAYVLGQSGWFSDRSAHYLASGRPVLAQSTGFEHLMPSDRGLLTFRTIEEVIEQMNAINSDYQSHCRAAREFAAEFLDYRKVLPKMLETCMSA